IEFDEIVKSNDVMFSRKCGVLASKISADNIVIYKWLVRKGSMTSIISKEILEIVIEVSIEKYNFLKKSLPYNKFKYVKFNFFAYIIKSLFVYHFGFKYTMRLIKLILDS